LGEGIQHPRGLIKREVPFAHKALVGGAPGSQLISFKEDPLLAGTQTRGFAVAPGDEAPKLEAVMGD
jgi:hypothetical protein